MVYFTLTGRGFADNPELLESNLAFHSLVTDVIGWYSTEGRSGICSISSHKTNATFSFTRYLPYRAERRVGEMSILDAESIESHPGQEASVTDWAGRH